MGLFDYALKKLRQCNCLPDPMLARFLTDADIIVMARLPGELERWRYRAARQHGNGPIESFVFAMPPLSVSSRIMSGRN